MTMFPTPERERSSRLAALREAMQQDLVHWVPEVVASAAARLEAAAVRNAVMADRFHTAEALTVLQSRNREFRDALQRSLALALADNLPSTPSTPLPIQDRHTLTLVDDHRIDEDIEIARTVQLLEAPTEWEVRQLAWHCSSLLGRDHIALDANPMHPAVVARAMCKSLDGFALAKPARLLLLRELGTVMGQRLRSVYLRHVDLLTQWGVRPAPLTVRRSSDDGGSPVSAGKTLRHAARKTAATPQPLPAELRSPPHAPSAALAANISVATAFLVQAVQGLERARLADAARYGPTLSDVARIAPEAAAVQVRLDRTEVENRLREQIVQQLRGTAAPAGLRQFLLGPWALVLTDAAVQHGEDGDPLRLRAALVDELIQACTPSRGATRREGQLEDVLARCREGLEDAAFRPNRIDAELAHLAEVLERPDPAIVSTMASSPATTIQPQPLPVANVIGLHDCLPTVPIDLDVMDTDRTTSAAQSRQAWLDGLEPGDCCRIFLQDRWMTAQLTWRSANHRMFVFASRHAGRTHTLTRRALERLRAAGLAATIEHGHFIPPTSAEVPARVPESETRAG